jgi:type III pantothenate kinase
MNLAIEFGNTNYKLAVLDQYQIVEKWVVENSKSFDLDLLNPFRIEKGIYAGSGTIQESLLESLNVLNIPTFAFDKHTDVSFSYSYRTPETLGDDRVLNTLGASIEKPEDHHLIIDIGTCTTISFLSNNEFAGGSISPGIAMRTQSLFDQTLALPNVELNEDFNDLIGQSTTDSIKSGVLNGLWAEIMNSIMGYLNLYENLNIYFTGGGADLYQNRIDHLSAICHHSQNKDNYLHHDFAFFSLFYAQNKIKCNIFADSNLIFKGMNHILLQK